MRLFQRRGRGGSCRAELHHEALSGEAEILAISLSRSFLQIGDLTRVTAVQGLPVHGAVLVQWDLAVPVQHIIDISSNSPNLYKCLSLNCFRPL